MRITVKNNVIARAEGENRGIGTDGGGGASKGGRGSRGKILSRVESMEGMCRANRVGQASGTIRADA